MERMPARRPIVRTPGRPAAQPIQPGYAGNPTPMHTPSAAAPQPVAQPNPAPLQPAQPAARPSLLQPPSLAGPSMDIRPATPAARPMATQPSGPAQPMTHHASHHPQPVTQTTPVSPATPARPLHHQQQPAAASNQHFAHPNTHHGHPVATHPSAQQSQVTPVQPATAHPTPPPTSTTHGHAQHPHHKTAESHNTKHHKEFHAAAHTGLVGFITFILVGAVCLAPLLPGKIWQNAPGSSQSFSTGDQNLDCLTTLGRITTTTSYDSKIGFPLTYNYSTTAHQSATCDGKVQQAVGGHASQFSPLALLIDFSLTVGLAIAAAKIWGKLRARKD